MQRLINKLMKFPRAYFFLRGLKRLTREAFVPSYAPKFSGWYGMTLYTEPPWQNSDLKIGSVENKFSIVDYKLKHSVKDSSFKLLQFEGYQSNVLDILSEQTWRHYIVYWSANYAAKNTKPALKNLVEVGVADGLTMYYAINAITNNDSKFRAYLYDTWERVDLINPSTTKVTSEYDNLDLGVTKKNLAPYNESLIFNSRDIHGT